MSNSTMNVAAVPTVVVADQGILSTAALNTFKALSSGAVAGAVSRTVTSPLERLKVMQQVQSNSTAYNGIINSLLKMYREEGLRSYWKGNGTNVARIAPFSAIQFFSFDVYKRLIDTEGTDNLSPLKTFTAGALTGMTASTICYPLDLVRSYLTVQTTGKTYNGIGHALISIIRADGVLGLYRGIFPTLAGIAPYIAINMTTFDLLKRKYLPNRDDPNFILMNLSLGAVAGFVSAGITYPTDLIRRRMQLQGMKGIDMPKYANTLDCVRSMIRNEGVTSLYKGLIPCFLKVVPSMAISFMLYEQLRKSLKFDPIKSKAPSAG